MLYLSHLKKGNLSAFLRIPAEHFEQTLEGLPLAFWCWLELSFLTDPLLYALPRWTELTNPLLQIEPGVYGAYCSRTGEFRTAKKGTWGFTRLTPSQSKVSSWTSLEAMNLLDFTLYLLSFDMDKKRRGQLKALEKHLKAPCPLPPSFRTDPPKAEEIADFI